MIKNKAAPNPDYVPAKYRINGIGDLAFVISLIESNAKRFKIKVHIESASELYPRKYSYVIEEVYETPAPPPTVR